MPDLEDCALLDLTDQRWLAFVTAHPQASIFHHPDWSNLLAKCYGFRPFVLVVQDRTGSISAGTPLMEIQSLITGRRWVSLPFTDYCPPLYRDQGSLNLLTRELVRLEQNGNIPRIEVRWELPPQPLIQVDCQYVLHTIELNADPEVNAHLFHRTQRQNIRTAEKKGVQIDRGDSLDQLRVFYHLHCLTRRRHGIPVQPWRFFELIFHNLIKKSLGFIMLAYQGNHPLAAGLFLHWQQTLTYKYAASGEEGQSLRPNHLLTWTAIRWGCKNGFRILDFGRTDLTDDGLRTFKNRWGSAELPLTYSTLSSKPIQTSSGILMSSMQSVIQKSPVWVCRAAGEILYKHFA